MFNRSEYDASLKRFEEAENVWPGGQMSMDRELGEVRLRTAICQRHLGDYQGAQETMMRALRLRNGVNWELFQSVVANQGAFLMYDDQAAARRLWSKGLRVARHAGDLNSVAHFTNDLAHLALMAGRYDEALTLTNEAMILAEDHGFSREEIRCGIIRGCIFIAFGDLALATHSLLRAQELAIANTNLRRLWRIRSNLATIAEIESKWEDAVARDIQATHHMPIARDMAHVLAPLMPYSRVTVAMINMAMRAQLEPALYQSLRKGVPADAWASAESFAKSLVNFENPRHVVGGLSSLYHSIGQTGVKRFLITE